MFTLHSVRQLMSRSIKTELLCLEGSRMHREALNQSIAVHTVKASGPVSPKAMFSTARLIKKNNFSLIHSQASRDLWLLVPALKLAKSRIPLVLTKQVGSFIVKKDFLHRFLYNRLTLALAISRVIEQNLLDTCPLTPEKIRLLHNGVDTRRFDPEKVDAQQVRKEYGIARGELVIGMLARFSPGKGHEEFLGAARILLKDYDNLKFMIVGEASRGENEYADSIKALAADAGLKNSVIFTGYRSDTPEVVASMDIFAFPSHNEAFGIALAEALSMGKPSVCSASDGVLDIAVDGVTSYLFKKQDAVDLAEKLKLLIDSAEKREAFGREARRRAVEAFDMELLTDRVIDIYKSLLL